MTTIVIEGPYEKIIDDIIKEGHAGSRTEVVRQALKAYKQLLKAEKEEEQQVVSRKVNKIVDDVESGKSRGYTLKEMREIFADKIDK